MLNFLLENFRLGLKNLHLHKLRSLLTAMGIIFGVAAVIIMVAIGQGAKEAARKQMEALGATNILIRSTPPPESNDATGRTQRTLEYGLKRVELARLDTVPDLTRIVPMRNTEQRVVIGDNRFNCNAIGTTPDIFDVINLTFSRGTRFSRVQYDQAASVCVLGAQAARDMYPYQDPIGQVVQLGAPSTGTLMVTVVGVLEPTGLRADQNRSGILDRDIDSDIYFPLTTAQNVFGDINFKRQAGTFERKSIELSEIWLQVNSVNNVEKIAGVVENVVGLPARKDVVVKAPIEILRAAEAQQRIFQFIMVGIASFSLVVGGIGIMNIMLATVTERTKEIGIRRALGAKRKHITLQFLIETTVISLTGGLIGIGSGATVATALPIVVKLFSDANYPTSITSWSVIGSFVVSGFIGIGFGMYPAIQAARMNPIEALRHE